MKEITVAELKTIRDGNEEHVLIDVREAHELEICEIGGTHIPMGDVMNNLDRIPKNIKVVIHCRSGARSGAVVQALETQHGYTNLYNLKGGIIAWADQVDSSITKY
ncbi:MAG: rhodanese-like domain-containing protein [Bacteroidia bacterium]|nr:rhodanese-like domain-containing protein [Bacteroidia bacterium]